MALTFFQSRKFFVGSRGFIFPNSVYFWKDRRNHKIVLHVLEGHLNINSLEDWYTIDFEKFNKLGGKKLLQEYNGCLYETLSSLVPETQWKWWKFQNLPKNYFQSLEHVRMLIEDIGVRIEDWYNIKQESLLAFPEGRELLLRNQNSLILTLTRIYPQYPWKNWKFTTEKYPMPFGYWNNKKNRVFLDKIIFLIKKREYLEFIAKEIGVKKYEDWYQYLHLVMDNDFESTMKTIMKYHEGSLTKTIQDIFSEYDWKPWLFQIAPQNLWEDKTVRRQFFDYLFKEMNCKTLEDLYMISRDFIREKGGDSLLRRYYDDDHIKALKDIYPEFEWMDWRFKHHAIGYWNFHGNDHRKLCDNLGKLLGVQKFSDWYQFGTSDFEKYGCSQILDHYGGSPIKLLMKVYPEFPWKPFLFLKAPRSFWEDSSNLTDYIKYIETQFNITHPDDWLNLNLFELKKFGISSVLEKYNGIMGALSIVYPNHKFNYPTGKGLWKSQSLLHKYISELCATKGIEDVHYNYIHPKFTFDSGIGMELDIFIPSLEIAFEYQGVQHFDTKDAFTNIDKEAAFKRDQQKRNECKKHGITLIEIPYWWDKSKESLFATIHRYRPDLWETPGTPIPETPPNK